MERPLTINNTYVLQNHTFRIGLDENALTFQSKRLHDFEKREDIFSSPKATFYNFICTFAANS